MKNITIENLVLNLDKPNQLEIRIPEKINNLKIINATLKVKILNPITASNYQIKFLSSLENLSNNEDWLIDQLVNVERGQYVSINISDEFQYCLDNSITLLSLGFEGNKTIEFELIATLNLDYIESAEFQGNGNKNEINLGKAGTSLINLVSGNMSLNTPLITSNNKTLPFSLNANYNSIQNDLTKNTGLPNKWSLNFNQFLIKNNPLTAEDFYQDITLPPIEVPDTNPPNIGSPEEPDTNPYNTNETNSTSKTNIKNNNTSNKESILSFTYIDSTGKSQILEEKYYVEEKQIAREDLIVGLDGKLIYVDDKNVSHEVITKLEASSRLTLVSSIAGLKGSNLVDYEPNELAQQRNQLKSYKKNLSLYNQKLQYCKEQIVLLSMSRYSLLNQLKSQRTSLKSREEDINYYDKIKDWNNKSINILLRQTIKKADNMDEQTLKDQIEKLELDKELSKQEFAHTYGVNVNEEYTPYEGSIKFQREIKDLDKLIYSSPLTEPIFRRILFENIPNLNIETSNNQNNNTSNKIEVHFDFLNNEIIKELWEIYKTAKQEVLLPNYVSDKDILSCDIQINECLLQYYQCQDEMTELNEQIEKCNYNVKQLEKQVPVHYLYDENNIIYGFGKTNDANIFRLILITDPYENTIFFNYASDETNKITSIRDSNKEYVSFKYNDNNLLVSIQDARDRKITLNYNNNNQIKSITFADNSTSYFYYDNDTLTTLLNQSGFGAKFTYSNNKVTKIESLSILDKVENGKIYYKQINQNSLLNNTTQNNTLLVNNPNSLETFNFEITNFTPYLLKDKTLYITYNNYMSTTLTNAKNKSITYNFDKFGNTTTTYENQIIEANDANTTKVTEYSYTNDLLTEKITKYINSKNYLKDVSFNPSHIVKTDSIMLGETLCNDATAFYEDKKTLNIFKISNFIARQKAESVHVPDSEITAINTINNYCDNKILIVSGWAKADSAFILTNEDKNNYPLYLQNRKFEIRVEVTYQNTTENDKPQIFSKSFDWRNTNWQYCAVPVIIQKNKNVASITCYIDYTNNTGSISYTNLDLYEGDYEHLEYNGKKQPKLKYSGHSNWITEYFYDNDNDNLIKEYLFDKSYFNDEDKFKHGYLTSYEYNKNNSLIMSISPLGIVKENIYDDKGRVIKSLTYHYSQPANVFYEEHNFDDFGNEAFSTNELGEKSSTYEYLNNTNITSASIDYLNNKTSYGYSKGDILLQSSTTVNGIDNANTYGYTLDFLTSLNHNDFDIIYNYDNLGRTSSINISDNNYLSYEYHTLENDINPDNSYLSEFREEILTLATGEVYKKVFNEYDNLLKLFYKTSNTSPFTEDNLILINSYDKFGNLIKTIENLNNKTIIHNYSIDKFGNVNNKQTFIDNNPIPEINISNSYDSEHDKLSSCHISISGKTLNYQYSYSTDPYKTLQNISLPNNFNHAILYDKLGRIDTLNLLNDNTTLTKKYTYLKNGDHTSNLVSLLSFASNNIINQKLSYKYDIKGNLTEVRSNNHLLARYSYDSLSRIVREDNSDLQKTFTFSYDAGGNITCKNEYAFTLIDNLETLTPTNTLTYFYPITGWRDQLIGLNNEEFEYDNLGNPFVYRDKTLCWSHGRQLDKFDNVDFTYNANGIRTSKTFMGNTTKYYLNGNRILAQSDTINTLYFHYGIDGVTGFNLDGIEYLYKKNIQNDIIGIYDTDGNEIVKYSYDAWGNHKTYILNDTGYVDISLKNTYTENGSLNKDIAEINPFRYRSYYYDSETNLYYLNSRYYDPEIGRFINADDISMLDITKNDFNGLNLYCYCLNNPITYSDRYGYWFLIDDFIGALVGLATGVIGQFVSDVFTSIHTGKWTFSSWETYLGAAVGGTIGGLASVYLGAGSGIIIGSTLSSLVGQGLESLTGTNVRSFKEIFVNTCFSAGIALLTAGMTKYIKIPNITSGSHSFLQIFNSGLTKVINHGFNMSIKTFVKGFIAKTITEFSSGWMIRSILSGMIEAFVQNFPALKHIFN